jgi:hypothetical protein
MTAFVEECRQEWKRLGVPDLLADEMATDLEADLAEAEAEGVSIAEIVGESDPRRFAASWASERGLVTERPEKPQRKVWPWVVGVIVFLLVGSTIAGALLASVGSHSAAPSIAHVVSTGPPSRQRARVRIPSLVGMRRAQALATARAAGLRETVVLVHGIPQGEVVAQRPAPGSLAPRGSSVTLRIARG